MSLFACNPNIILGFCTYVNNRYLLCRKAVAKNVEKLGGADSCWLWTGKRNRGGYGVLSSGELAHRAAWAIDRGEEPAGLAICHSCDNRRCINPRHLFQNIAKANTHDALRKGRHTRQDASMARRLNAIARRQVRRDAWLDANQIDTTDFIGLALDGESRVRSLA